MDLAILFGLFIISNNVLRLSSAQATFDVTKYGAIGNGATDDTQAFLKAWAATCGAQGTATMVVPKGKIFLLQSVVFGGPCKPKVIHLQVDGTLQAPKTLKSCLSISWLNFERVGGLTIDGVGKIDGQGASWWKSGGVGSCGGRPTALKFFACNDLRLAGLTHVDSPQAHIFILNCTRVVMSNLHITAPEDSPNTDGIDIMRSSIVEVKDTVIATGDDCIAIKDGTSFINITKVVCGPGHGISIGSLGKDGKFESSENIQVRGCTFNGASNGARIKTYSGGKGYVRDVVFEDITLNGVDYPIIIDQNYCSGRASCPKMAVGIPVTGVTYKNVHGTSTKDGGIKLDCNNGNGCKNIVMDNVKIVLEDTKKPAEVTANNVHGKESATFPAVPMNN